MTLGRVVLKRGREAPARGGSPWIFSQALASVDAGLQPGALVEVRDADGGLVGYGHLNPNTTIAVRILAWGDSPAPTAIVRHRLKRALEARRSLIDEGTDCYRMVNGDGDGLSGVIVDRYADVAVVQLLTAGADRVRAEIVAALEELIAPRAILERSQGAVRRQEGLADRVGPLAGKAPPPVIASERGFKIAVEIEEGQKTGWFLDQRENRARVERLARGARVLDLCCYAGGFSLAAIRGGASEVVAVDTSRRALSWAERNLKLNGYCAARLVHADAGDYLTDRAEAFDLIVLDPPPLARRRKDAARAEHLYVELNARALKALAPGGSLMTFSCSAHVGADDFLRVLRIAQNAAGRRMCLVEHLGAAPDHPVLLGHAEGEYLTGLTLTDLESTRAA